MSEVAHRGVNEKIRKTEREIEREKGRISLESETSIEEMERVCQSVQVLQLSGYIGLRLEKNERRFKSHVPSFFLFFSHSLTFSFDPSLLSYLPSRSFALALWHSFFYSVSLEVSFLLQERLGDLFAFVKSRTCVELVAAGLLSSFSPSRSPHGSPVYCKTLTHTMTLLKR